MLGKTSQLELSRRVSVYYLVFALAAITWLVVGVVVVARSVLRSQDEADCLAVLGEVANAARSELAAPVEGELQSLVERFRSERGLA